ncbi:piggyBac transposable element-derived protein 4 [Coregonus clupeaformis]|uniref:piggyBac transposable element-derived protein 4 n=1 Tax=Coregonus clupeaformis TaxID=59861 RepID=UPI001BDFE5AF|nr:piggyBac transposable element-derived protein 4 [Coregonus clupeaformis]
MMEQEEVEKTNGGAAKRTLFGRKKMVVCDNSQQGNPNLSKRKKGVVQEDEGSALCQSDEDIDGDSSGGESDNSFLDPAFEEELDQRIKQEENEDFHLSETEEESNEEEDHIPEATKARVSKSTKATSSPKAAKQRESSCPWTPRSAKRQYERNAPGTSLITGPKKWKNEDEPDEEPNVFRFCPARTPGAQLDPYQNYTPLELFRLFFNQDVVDTLCSNTNKNATRRKESGNKRKWRPLLAEELYKYLSIVIYMGLMSGHGVGDYWSKRRPYQLPFCRSVMGLSRYQDISWSLHMSDPAEDEENENNKGTAEYDQLMRIKPLKDQILGACRAFYHPFQNLSIDERMVRSKACNSLKQYIKTKRYKYGFKLYILADSRNGYTCDFNVFMSKNPSTSGKGENYDAVMNLLNVTYLGTGYHLYVDNFFTSATLFRDLYEKNIGACGTLRENREGLSRIQENSMPPRAERGTIRWLRDGELLFTKWMDARPVTMCSTIHKASVEDQEKRRKRGAGGIWTLESVSVPNVIKCYNKYMGGVDLSDALIKYYSVAHKTMKWYKTFFYHFVDIAVVNSYLLYKDMAVVKKEKLMTHKQFREKLCVQLAGIGEEDEEEEEQQECHKAQTKTFCCPVSIIDQTTIDIGKRATAGRKKCLLCQLKTNWKCDSCGVPLCMIPDRNCFRAWHLDKRARAEKPGPANVIKVLSSDIEIPKRGRKKGHQAKYGLVKVESEEW